MSGIGFNKYDLIELICAYSEGFNELRWHGIPSFKNGTC